jgi:hypothetical protein
LALAAHLRAAGVKTQVFGELMGFWRHRTPLGMSLVSSWGASHIAHPQDMLTLDEYEAARGVRLARPIPREDFIRYACWFGQQIVPDLDQRLVARVEPSNDDFQVTLEDGEVVHAKRVVIAVGLTPFIVRPAPFRDLPAEIASHTADHCDLGRFAGQRVLVVGAGQSALTSAALLHEAGAEVEVLARATSVRWTQRHLHRYGALAPLRRLLYAPTDVGPAGLSRLVGAPGLYRQLPHSLRERITARATRPSGAFWLRPRVDGVVPLTSGRAVTGATLEREGLRVTLDDQSERLVDHALLATGYRVDIRRYSFLVPELARAVRCIGGAPILDGAFESSVPNLHFVGAASAGTFGPVMRFVSGTRYTARAVTGRIVGRAAGLGLGRRRTLEPVMLEAD